VTIILYESPHRLVKCLEEIHDLIGSDRKVCVAREISKLYEEFLTLPVSEAISHYTATPAKGEIVIIIEGNTNNPKPKKEKRRDDQI
jgi:16S rRNA (cytidine1402-2'-O)-methyltransferase